MTQQPNKLQLLTKNVCMSEILFLKIKISIKILIKKIYVYAGKESVKYRYELKKDIYQKSANHVYLSNCLLPIGKNRRNNER